jgi:hypothetical protein
MDEVKFLEVVFENVESVIIPTEKVKEFTYGELSPTLHEYLDDTYYRTDRISLKIAYEDENELKYDPSPYDEPLGMFVGNPTSNRVTDRPNILGRLLLHTDIVAITTLDENEQKIKMIYVPWSDDSDYENSYMSTKAQEGLLEIVISK